ncbi:hypothetical protein FRC04_012244 [Tulasnella sp. 424]|nr:hypothetical protein FRC04_012244 [Tulasnella sp. 424]KAG8973729.1 hypothetical protein FRC05_008317 [Tulasnella sp. 425]
MAEKMSLLATCQYLRRLSEPLLYSHLDPDGNWKSCRRVQVLKTLGERHGLLPHIRFFRGHLIPTSIRRPSKPEEEVKTGDFKTRRLLEGEWFAISAPLLSQAVNIRDLEITDRIDWQANSRWELFKSAISNMKLRSLALGSTSKEPLDFTPILRGQPELTRLELTYPTAHFEGLENSDVQKLKVFRGTWQQAATIVPGRPVRRLDLGCGDTDECHCPDEHIFQKLLQSSETVREFKVRAHTVSYRSPADPKLSGAIQLIIRYLPNIVDFAIVEGGEISAQTLLEEIPKLSMISSLMILDSWLIFTDPSAGIPSFGSDHLDIDTWEKLSERLKELCPSLGDVGYTPRRMIRRCGMFELKIVSSSWRFI